MTNSRAIVEKSAINAPLIGSMRAHALDALKRPGRFVFQRPFGIMWTLYAATYSVANGAETLSQGIQSSTAWGLTFASTMLVNIPLAVWKDIRFAQLYGIGGPSDMSTKTRTHGAVRPVRSRAIARIAAAIFLVRDGITIFGSFTLAPWLSTALPQSHGEHPHAIPAMMQLGVPVLTQFFATPLHLLGLDFYTRQESVPLSRRLAQSQRYLPSSTVVRCMRIIPAFGFGCLINSELRAFLHDNI